MTHQFKDHVLFTLILKSLLKCAEEESSLYMVVHAVLQEMTAIHQLLDVQQDVLYSVTQTEER
jgi:hypothetical protein